MDATVNQKEYKSPIRKLAAFFEKSRDRWKDKYIGAKADVKRLKNKVRFLAESKNALKQRLKVLEYEMNQLRSQKQEMESESKKKSDLMAKQITCSTDAFDVIAPYHSYSIGHIFLYLSLVLSASAGLRCSSRVIQIVLEFFALDGGSPSWTCGRLWLLRLGYYKLTKPKEKASDWVWIIDHTVQIGIEKCFVILGVRLSCLPAPGQCIRHEDMEPIMLLPVKKSDGDVVWQQLEEATAKTGVPREILGDHGSDLITGVNKFCQNHPETCSIYDIKHKTAAILKREFKDNEEWLKFNQLSSQTASKVRQTSLAFLCPPNQRSKSRYMNIDVLVRWGSKTLRHLDRGPEAGIDPEVVEKKLGWLTGYRKQLGEWEEILSITEKTESFVRNKGICRGCDLELSQILKPLVQTEQSNRIYSELLSFVETESLKARPNERLPGSSEVIESIFGKLKYLEKSQSTNGFTGLILSIAAMVAKNTRDIVQDAIETVRTKDVLKWCREMLGESVQAKRKKAFSDEKKTEQKWDQVVVAV